MKYSIQEATMVGRQTGRQLPGGSRESGIARTARLLALMLCLCAGALVADTADVTDAKIVALGDGRYRIDATVAHPDTGWDHYANAFSVFSIDGTLLGTRELAHPHVEEQPFTRSLTVELPPGTERIVIRAVDSVHGAGGASVELEVPADAG